MGRALRRSRVLTDLPRCGCTSRANPASTPENRQDLHSFCVNHGEQPGLLIYSMHVGPGT
jgi:hypothetical protein